MVTEDLWHVKQVCSSVKAPSPGPLSARFRAAWAFRVSMAPIFPIHKGEMQVDIVQHLIVPAHAKAWMIFLFMYIYIYRVVLSL